MKKLIIIFGMVAAMCVTLWAAEHKDKAPAKENLTGTKVNKSFDESGTLLPTVPSEPPVTSLMFSRGAPVEIEGPIPGIPAPDPDGFKALYGYVGPFYNIRDLDGRVAVIEKSIYLWKSSSWVASGMIRNQTRSTVRLREAIAKIYGDKGEVIDSARVELPIEIVRPGEPVPFIVHSTVPAEAVRNVEWLIDYEPTAQVEKKIEISVLDSGIRDGEYTVLGEIRNDSGKSVNSLRVEMAWLNAERQVVYLDSANVRLIRDLSKSALAIDLEGGATGMFDYSTVSEAAKLNKGSLVLWSVYP